MSFETNAGAAARAARGTLEELLLFLLDDKTHRIHVDERTRDAVVGGAILLDLVPRSGRA